MKGALEVLALLLVAPLRIATRLGGISFMTGSLTLSLIPGQAGKFLRRAWYSRELEACGKDLVVDFGAAIRSPRSRVGDNVYIGLHNWFGLVDIADDFVSGSHVVILSGNRQHRFNDASIPMRLQHGEHRRVKVGEDVWVGTHCTVMADVAPRSVVAAGAVVTKTHEPGLVLCGVPAMPLRRRDD